MRHLTLVIGTMLAVSLAAHVAIAQLRPPPHRPFPTLPGPPRKAPKPKPLPPRPPIYVEEANGVVYIEGKDQVYFVAARQGERVVDAKIAAGPYAEARFRTQSTQQGAVFDVYAVSKLGAIDIQGFKPCLPRTCTPVDFPPDIIKTLRKQPAGYFFQ